MNSSHPLKSEESTPFTWQIGITIIMLAILFLTACGTEPALEPTPEPSLSPTFEPTVEPTPISTPIPTYELVPSPPFYLGVDLSYVNEMDDCGAVYLENGEPQDAFQLFSSYGANLVRARLWHNPDWTDYSDPDDIERTFRRAKEAGMHTLLDFHYSDNWADPGKQAIPAAWEELDDDELVQAVYDYTYEVLWNLNEKQLIPDFVQVGNETNSGLLKPITELDWPRDADLFNAGIQAVRDVADATNTNPRIILHVAQPENAGWWFRQAMENGIIDFDVIGLSYYPQWSLFSVSDVGAHVNYLRRAFQKDVMIVETAYPWTLDAVDETADNILNQGVRGYAFTPEGQRQFMVDLSQNLIANGGLGVVYWEPAWVSTSCSTRWGQGSHWENATFFDFKNNNELHRGIEFLSYDYLYPNNLADGVIEENYQDPLILDDVGDNLEAIHHLDLLSLHAKEEESFLFLALTISGDVFDNPAGRYLIYIDLTEDEHGADVDVGRRPITVADPYKPEFRLDIYAIDRRGTINGSYELYAWDGIEWQEVTFTGGRAIHNGTPSVIEIQFPQLLFGNPEFINLSVVSTGRGRVHTAGDILGSTSSPAAWNKAVELDTFYRFNLEESN
jgi:arabinogalactan endo-1,4-beta-galactosidase